MKPVNPFDPLGQNAEPKADLSSLALVGILVWAIITLVIIWACIWPKAGA
jgi:hypothetical protein